VAALYLESSAVLSWLLDEPQAEPVRNLDAVHIATALEVQELYPDLEVLSLDQRILDNLVPLGLRSSQP
jgi:hypothetical protein